MTNLLSEDNMFLISRCRLQTRNRNAVRTLRELWCSKTIERSTDAGLRQVTVNNNKIRRAINIKKTCVPRKVLTVVLPPSIKGENEACQGFSRQTVNTS